MPPEELLGHQCAEKRIGDQVPSPEPPRFLADAVEPFEPEPLPDEGSPANLACENVERSPHAVAHWDAQLITPAGEEPLLLGRAHPHQQDVRPSVREGRDKAGLLLAGEVAV